jgi:peptidoglycan/LPS O-acetylase OafA/YrhL
VPGFYHVSIGGVGVTVFLILSGAVLQRQHGSSGIDHARFMARRAVRLYPVYYVSVLVSLGVYALRAMSGTEGIHQAFPALGLDDIALGLTATYAFVGEWGGPLVGTSWFIGLIMALYLLFPPLSRGIRAHPHAALGALLAVSVASRFVLGHWAILPGRPLDWFPLCRVFEFGLGVYLVTVLAHVPVRRPALPAVLRAAALYGSRLSLPLFLVHTRVTFLLPYLTGRGVGVPRAVAVFVLATLALSGIVLAIDDRVPRAAILAWIERALDGLGRARPGSGRVSDLPGVPMEPA